MPAIRLNKEDEDFIARQLESGLYESADELISAGLDLVRERDRETLEALIQEGLADIEAGRVHEYSSAEQMLADILGADGDA